MPRIRADDGADIHYSVHGDGPAVMVFLHGWGGNVQMWSAVVSHLDASQCRCLCIDLRGHGKSAGAQGGFSWPTFAEDVLAVADHERAQTFTPVGFSMGGKLSCFLAAKHAERIPAQILVAPVAPGTVSIDREVGLRICRESTNWIRAKEFFLNWFGPSTDQEIVNAGCEAIAETSTPVLEATVEMIAWTSFAEEIGKLDLPTLLVIGENDPVYGMGYQQKEMVPFLGQSQLEIISCGHFIPLESPVRLAKLISTFVARANRP
jgi:non-heme chloroperoxidase